MPKYKTSVKLDKNLVQTFKRFYPQKGSLQWFLEESLKHFNKIHVDLNDPEIKLAVEKALTSHLTNGEKI